jgi:hypothetical protein
MIMIAANQIDELIVRRRAVLGLSQLERSAQSGRRYWDLSRT